MTDYSAMMAKNPVWSEHYLSGMFKPPPLGGHQDNGVGEQSSNQHQLDIKPSFADKMISSETSPIGSGSAPTAGGYSFHSAMTAMGSTPKLEMGMMNVWPHARQNESSPVSL